MQQTIINGKTYLRKAHVKDCFGCAAFKGGQRNDWLCDALPNCSNSIWVEVPGTVTVTTPATPYEACMKEYNKYSQYDSVEMDEFERGCIMGRKLQSLKLAKVFENG